jgi:putative flippase GtrA
MKRIHRQVKSSILFIIDATYPLFKRVLSLQTYRYAACGGVNTVLDIGLFSFNYNVVFKKHNVMLGFITLSPHIAALMLAFCITLPTGFYLNRYVVFQQSGLRRRSQLVRYLTVVFGCVVLNFIFLKLFVDYIGWYPTPSKILTTLIVIVFSYVSQTFYFFKAKPTAHSSN